jgi:hypothetical protein
MEKRTKIREKRTKNGEPNTEQKKLKLKSVEQRKQIREYRTEPNKYENYQPDSVRVFLTIF